MKKIYWILSFLLVFIPNMAMRKHTYKTNIEKSFEAKQIEKNTNLIIMYDSKIGKKELLKAVKEYNAELIYEYKFINGIAVKAPNGKVMEEVILFFKNVEGVISVEEDKILTID